MVSLWEHQFRIAVCHKVSGRLRANWDVFFFRSLRSRFGNLVGFIHTSGGHQGVLDCCLCAQLIVLFRRLNMRVFDDSACKCKINSTHVTCSGQAMWCLDGDITTPLSCPVFQCSSLGVNFFEVSQGRTLRVILGPICNLVGSFSRPCAWDLEQEFRVRV